MSYLTSFYSQPILTRPVRTINKSVLFISTSHIHIVNVIRVDDEHSQSLIKGVTLGTITPGETALETLYLKNTGGVGDRVLDISIQSRSPVSRDTSEVLRTLSVPTVAPMKVEYGVKYLHARGPLPGLTDLQTYEGDYWDDGEGGEALVSARMACVGPWGVSVETVRLVRKVSLLRPVVCHGGIYFS
jgi:trafficking protein particle complex subunit 11